MLVPIKILIEVFSNTDLVLKNIIKSEKVERMKKVSYVSVVKKWLCWIGITVTAYRPAARSPSLLL